MTDLEITKLCAEAMGYDVVQRTGRKEHGWWAFELCKHYQPLHDDAQAMALLKRFPMKIDRMWNGNEKAWLVMDAETAPTAFSSVNGNVNRAICETVAKMQAAKT